MRNYMLTFLLFFSTAASAQQGESSRHLSPVLDLSVGSNMISSGSHGNEWNPAHKLSVAAGLALPTRNATLTARLCLTADAVRTTFDDNLITKKYIAPTIDMEYDHVLSPKWFVGLDISLGLARMYDWEVDKSSTSSQKSRRVTLEEELASMKNSSRLNVIGAQFIAGYSLSKRLQLRAMIHYSMSNFVGDGNGRYSDNRESLIGLDLSVQYNFIRR
jgi:hypothetical protein